MRYVGVDYSMNSPAVVVDSTDDGLGVTAAFFSKKIGRVDLELPNGQPLFLMGRPMPEWENNMERFVGMAESLIEDVPSGEDVVGVVEGYAYSAGSRGRVFEIAECCQTFKVLCMKRRGLILEAIPPSSLKDFATGKGNAGKDMMAEAFRSETGHLLHEVLSAKRADSSPSSDIVDAYFAARKARRNYGGSEAG